MAHSHTLNPHPSPVSHAPSALVTFLALSLDVLACGRTTALPTSLADGSSPEVADLAVLPPEGDGQGCALPDMDLDDSCAVDLDCVAVPAGDPCSPDCSSSCKTAAVNAAVAERYLTDFLARSGPLTGLRCNCPCRPFHPCCREGKCVNGCEECNF